MTSEKSSALHMLSTYESDSSDEDVPSSRIKTKRILHDSIEEAKKLKPEKLPLPTLFTQPTDTPDHEDNPDLHGGRIRSFPHERGNWSTFIYLYFEETSHLNDLIEHIKSLCAPFVQLEKVSDFHLSLTKTVILKHHWIDPFISSVRERIRNSMLRRFIVFFNDVQVYVNEEKTRTFLGFSVNTGYDSLMVAVKIFDECLSEFKLEPFYKDPSFHMSILWCLGDKKDELDKLLPEINNLVKQYIQKYPDQQWYIDAKCFMCKIGNKQVVFHLP